MRYRLLTLVGFASLSALSARAAVAGPSLVADLNAGSAWLALPPFPTSGVERDGVRFFPAADPQHGYELWRTDGTAAGTTRLTDLCPGPCAGAAPLAALHDRVLFLGNDGGVQQGLWSTDGTVGGERFLSAFCAPGCSRDLTGNVVLWHDKLWMLLEQAGNPAVSPVLWSSDGTPEGTGRVAELCGDLGLCSPNLYAYLAASTGGGLILYVQSPDPPYTLEYYRTDGTRSGTVLVHRFGATAVAARPNPGRRAASSFDRSTPAMQLGSDLVGRALTAPSRHELPASKWAAGAATTPTAEPLYFVDGVTLWISDGTPEGTHSVADLSKLASDLYTLSTEVVDGNFYAIFNNGEWIRSDGTAAGTVLLAKVASQFRPTVARLGSSVFAVTVNGLWRTGGTAATTERVAATPPGDVLTVIEQPDRLFVMGWENGGFVWTTDGTAAGTRRIHLPAGPYADQYEMSALGGGVAFSRGGDQLWGIDADGRHPHLLHAYQPADGPSVIPGRAVLGEQALLYAYPTVTPPIPYGIPTSFVRLFATDGTPAGTRVVTTAADAPYVAYFGPPQADFFRDGNRVFFNGNQRLWVTDGTARGTQPLRKRGQVPNVSTPIAARNGRVLFAGYRRGVVRCDPGESEPGVSDGTARGTHELLDLNPYEAPGSGSQCETTDLSSDPGPGIALGTAVLFAADDLVHGTELFATDGTAAGTRLVADIDPDLVPNDVTDPDSVPKGPDKIGVGSFPTDFARLGDRALFAADDGKTGRELWVTNGTRTGTRQVADIAPGASSSAPHGLVALGGFVYFFAAQGDGEALMRSDGTAQGTTVVDVLSASARTAAELTVAGQRLFFTLADASAGRELWTSDGTHAGTHRVADLRPGSRGSAPQHLAAVGGLVVFAADDGVHGLEPWRSDGTAAGTRSLGDLAAGRDASGPDGFQRIGDRLLFDADDGVHGRELWSLPVAEVLRP